MKRKTIPTLVLTLALMASMAVSASAADYSFTTDPKPDYYGSTNYEDLYDAGYNYGARNQIDYDIPELKYGLSQEFLETSLDNPYLGSGIQYGIGGGSGTTMYPESDFSNSSIISGGTIELPYRPYLTVADLTQKDGSIGTVSIKRIGLSAKVYEGATDASMAKGAGHYTGSGLYDGNIGLFGHLLIQYVRAREVNNLSGYSGEILDKFMSYIPLVDSCIFDEDARARFEAVNQIMIDLWPMMQRCFDDLRDKKQQAQQNQQQQSAAAAGSGNGSGSSGGSSDDESKDAGTEAIKEALESQLPKAPVNFTGKTGAVPSNGSFVPDKDQEAALLAQMERVLSEETARIAAHKTNGIESVGDGGVTQDGEYEGYGYGHAAEDIERLLENMAQGRINEAMEEELSEGLQREADSIRYGNAHRNIHVTVHRMAQVDQTLVDSYSSVAPQLLLLSKRLQRSVSPILRDKRQGGKQTGLYVGKRLNQHAFHRDDGRIFCNTRLPTEPINLAVALLIDESGSMCGSDRITRARATAIVVQDFCEKLGIPIMITGHTASNSHVELFSYAEFDSVDKKDRYRLMDMSARCCNRDGAALRFVAEKLSKQPAEVKMLFIICDGQPNDTGYSGTEAEADLRGIKLEYSRKGVQIFAAAIGDDRDRIERIYGAGFLDITDLNQLPVMLTNLISRHLPL